MKRLRASVHRAVAGVRSAAADILAVAGVACLAVGAALVAVPLGWIVLGAFLILAAGYHLSRGEAKSVPINLIFLALAAFVAWGRFGKGKIAPRS